MKKKAVVLLSGGVDSSTAAAVAADMGYEIHAITFIYGQKHRVEVRSAKRIAGFLKIKNHIMIKIPAKLFSSSALSIESGLDIPTERNISENDIPPTYVPARNIIFLSCALAYAETAGAGDIFIGVNSLDYSGYPDCRPEFIKAFEETANIGTKSGISGGKFIIRAPLISLKKSEIIKLGASLGLDYSLTHSCYNPSRYGAPCGKCDSCRIRRMGFAEAGITDPARYRD